MMRSGFGYSYFLLVKNVHIIIIKQIDNTERVRTIKKTIILTKISIREIVSIFIEFKSEEILLSSPSQSEAIE